MKKQGVVMYELNANTINLINKACKGKKHIRLTVGYLLNDVATIRVFSEGGEITSPQMYSYEIGSITKTFTTSLLSKYIFEKKMSLHDPIQKYIKGLDPDCYYPSLLRLSTHSSGYSGLWPLSVPEYFNYMVGLIFGGEMRRTNLYFMDFNKMKMFIQKGKLKDMDYSWKYSNFGMALVGYAISAVSGKPYWDTMNDFLFNELKLADTRLGTFQSTVHGYDGKNNDCGNWHWDDKNLIAPSSALTSTAEDLLQYTKLIINEERSYLSLCHQKHGEGISKHDMGLAWWLLKQDNNIIWHCGGTGCFSSFLGINTDKKTASVVLSNYQFGVYPDDKIGFSVLNSLHTAF